MSYSNSDVAHRWANGIGFNSGSQMSATETSVYSYSTVIAQCLDREKQLFVVIDKSLTHSTSKHIGYVRRAIPGSAHVISTHRTGGYYDNVEFLSYWKNNNKFDKSVRLEMVTHFLRLLYDEYELIERSSSLEDENVEKKHVGYINLLNQLYGDCSLSIWLRHNKTNDRKSKRFKLCKLARMVMNGKSDPEIADTLFGKGTWAAFQERVAPAKKAAATREHTERLKDYLFFKSKISKRPYYRRDCYLSSKELKKLSARERLEIKFSNIYYFEHIQKDDRSGLHSYDFKQASIKRAMKFLGLDITSIYQTISKVVKPDGTKVYNRLYPSAYYWDNVNVGFDFQQFCAAPDKFLYRERFWKICELKQRRIIGGELFDMKLRADGRDEPFEMTEEENHIYNEFVVRKNRYEADIERRRKLAEEERKRKEREALEKISAYNEQGIDGVRNIWREHLGDLPYEVKYSHELNYGGNVLLRFSRSGNRIETSKGITIDFEDCHRYWRIIKDWHDNGTFNPGTTMAGYRVVSFKNDILTAGCHEIAFCEMQRMYEELCKRETA